MAGTDELFYVIRLKADEGDVNKVSNQIGELQKQFEKLGTEDAQEATKGYAESVNEMNESNAKGISRLAELQESIDGYKNTLSELKAEKRKKGTLDQREAQQEAVIKARLKETNAEYRREQAAVIASGHAVEGKARTYNELVARNRELASAMRDVPMDDQGEALGELKEEWAENNETLKEFDEELGDHRRNVGNYEEAVSTAASGIAAFQGPLGPIAGRLNALNTTVSRAIPLLNAQAGAWVAVRRAMLGIIGLGVVGLIAAIVAAMRTLQPVIDNVALRVKQVGAAWGNFADLVGSALGMNERTNKSLSETLEITRELHQAQIDLEEAQIRSITVQADLEAQIARLRRQAEDENNTYADRIGMMDEALDRTKELFAIRADEQAQTVAIMKQEIDLAVSTRQERQELANAEAELIRLRAQQDTQMRQLIRRRQTIINSLEVEEQRRQKNIESIRLQRKEALQSIRDRVKALNDEMLISQEERAMKRQIELARKSGNESTAIYLESQLEMTKLTRKFAEERDNIKEEFEEQAQTRAEQMMEENVTRADIREKLITKVEKEAAQNKAQFGVLFRKRQKKLEERFVHDVNKEIYNMDLSNYRRMWEEKDEILTNSIEETTSRKERARLFEERQIHRQNRQQIIMEKVRADAVETIEKNHNRHMAQYAENLKDQLLMTEEAQSDKINEYVKLRFENNLSRAEAMTKARLNLSKEENEQLISLEQTLQEQLTRIRREAAFSQADAEEQAMERRWNAEEQSLISISQLSKRINERMLAREATGSDELVRIEQQRASRQMEIQRKLIDEGLRPAAAERQALLRSELEFKEQKAQTEKRLAQEKEQYARDMTNETAAIVVNSLEAVFHENKAARIAQAIVNTAAAASEALASSSPPLSWLRMAAVISAGAAQVRQIKSTEIGSRSVGDTGGGQSRGLGFNVSDFGKPIGQDGPAQQVVEQGRAAEQERNTTIVLEGDMDPEVMAVKVREGNASIGGNSINVNSEQE